MLDGVPQPLPGLGQELEGALVGVDDRTGLVLADLDALVRSGEAVEQRSGTVDEAGPGTVRLAAPEVGDQLLGHRERGQREEAGEQVGSPGAGGHHHHGRDDAAVVGHHPQAVPGALQGHGRRFELQDGASSRRSVEEGVEGEVGPHPATVGLVEHRALEPEAGPTLGGRFGLQPLEGHAAGPVGGLDGGQLVVVPGIDRPCDVQERRAGVVLELPPPLHRLQAELHVLHSGVAEPHDALGAVRRPRA